LAASTDAGALAKLDSLVNPSPWSEQQFLAACLASHDGGERVLLIESRGQLQGFVVYCVVLDEASIYNIAVLPASQGRGLGKVLLDTVIDRARAAGARRFFLEVRASNRAARSLYQKFGFTLDSLRKNYYRSATGREDALLMSLQFGE